MDYKIKITADAQEDLEAIIQYLLFEKKNGQAAGNVLDDFENTKNLLKQAAGSLKQCENPRLAELGYRRINFMSHKYFMMYRIEGDTVIIDNIFHALQDHENKMS